MNRPARVAMLRARVNRAEQRLRELAACRDWLGMPAALAEYWQAAGEWRATLNHYHNTSSGMQAVQPLPPFIPNWQEFR